MTKEDPNNLKLIHQNIQGLPGKELELELFLEETNVDILCITEHWLNQHQQLIVSINNYKLISSFTRHSAIRGGSLILLKNYLKCKQRKDIESLSVERTIEISCAELDQHIIVCIYRPPSANYDSFESSMEEVLRKVCATSKRVIVCGDFNINILEDSQSTIRFLNLFKSFNLHHLFNEPTRVTPTSATCLDNIFCDCNVGEKAIINFINSDHSGQMAVIDCHQNYSPTIFTCRPITKRRVQQFKDTIYNKVSSIPCNENSVDQLYDNLFEIVEKEFNGIFTKKTIKLNNSKNKFSDWATTGIYISRRKLFELYDIKASSNDPATIEYVKNYSKCFKKVCAVAKSNYIKDKISNATNKIKITWNVINKETCKNKTQQNKLSLKINGKCLDSDAEVAKAFESFFTNIPVSTTSKLDSSSDIAVSLLKASVGECKTPFKFTHVTPEIIVKTFKELNMKKTEDLWGLSVDILRNIILFIAPHLAMIFNKCVDEGQFPSLMKYSKIIPLFKSGDKSDPSNFRPVSILPALSKIFEKVIFVQLLSHFKVNDLLHNKQFGFTKGKSTSDAGVALIKHIFDAWENKQDAIGVFCDLSKAFDCVKHQTLLLKLSHYGVSKNSLSLINSYLSDRVQKVNVNGTDSSGAALLMGVPQGSILGPLLFLIYINDLPYFTQDLCEIVLFADDTSLIFNVDRRKDTFDDVNDSLSQVLHWFTTNNLLLNAKKTKCVKFTMPNVRQVNTNIIMNNERIEVINSTVFLGITMDAKLQWGPHIAALAGRLSSAAYAVKKIRHLTDIETARLVYFSYFHSIMSYGLLLWGSAADIQTIFVLQKRAIRFIYNLRPRDSLREMFKNIDILTVASQYILDCILYVRKNIHLFSKKSECHGFNTRNKHRLAVPNLKLQKISSSFVGLSIKMYNKLPQNVIDLPIHKFKTHVKACLIKKGYYKIVDYLNDKDSWV